MVHSIWKGSNGWMRRCLKGVSSGWLTGREWNEIVRKSCRTCRGPIERCFSRVQWQWNSIVSVNLSYLLVHGSATLWQWWKPDRDSRWTGTGKWKEGRKDGKKEGLWLKESVAPDLRVKCLKFDASCPSCLSSRRLGTARCRCPCCCDLIAAYLGATRSTDLFRSLLLINFH